MLGNALAGPSRARQVLSAVHRVHRQLATVTSPSDPVPRRRRRSDIPAKTNDSDVDLVAPPDPLSNIRPVLYAASGPLKGIHPPAFAGDSSYYDAMLGLKERELEWVIFRQRVDTQNHRFWARQSIAFDAQQEHLLSLVPLSDPPTEIEIKRRDEALTQFYADWQIANRRKQRDWVIQWWREVRTGLILQAKLYTARFFWRVFWSRKAPKKADRP